MGIVNVTPDSFSDGGLFLDPELAIAPRARARGRGRRPARRRRREHPPGRRGGDAPSVELERIAPVVAALAGPGGPGSRSRSTPRRPRSPRRRSTRARRSSTTSPRCAATPSSPALCAERGCAVVLMHMQGSPRTMQDDPRYDDVVDDVRAFLAERIEAAVAAGDRRARIWVDPGIGFGKTVEHNLELLRRLGELRELGRPIVDRHLAQALPRRAHRPRGRRPARRHRRLERARARRRRRRLPGSRRRRAAPGARRRRGPILGRRGWRTAATQDTFAPRGSARRAESTVQVELRGLSIYTHHGVTDAEQEIGQRLVIDVSLRRPRLRRGAHRPARGHDRLRRGRRHRRPRGDRAQLPDARAAGGRDRRAADGALRLRLGPRAGGEARAADAAGDRGGRRSRSSASASSTDLDEEEEPEGEA